MKCPPNNHFKNITYDHLEFTRLAVAARLAYLSEYIWRISLEWCNLDFRVICNSGSMRVYSRCLDVERDWNKPEIIKEFCGHVIRAAKLREEDPEGFLNRVPSRV